MAALIQFVDSIDADPTVRLDLSDGLSWFCTRFSAPPPRLRRSESENSMRDGGIVGSSSYGNRTLELDLTLIEEGDEEWAADEMQKLWRELDRPTNVIRYWPDGLDAPVFFRTFRSDVSELEELWTTPIARNISLEVLAEPHAVGLPETLGPFTVANDSSAGTNPLSLVLSDVLGDVETPVAIVDDTAVRSRGIVAVSGSTAPEFYAAESGFVSKLTDTANPGGGPDVAMSGTGTNNYVQTSFASDAGMVARLAGYSSGYPVTFRVFAVVRRSDSTSPMTARLVVNGAPQTTVTIPLSTSRQLVDLGRIDPFAEATTYSALVTSVVPYSIEASRASGSGTLDWDTLYFIPADGVMASWSTGVADNLLDNLHVVSYPDSAMTKRSTPTTILGTVPFSGDTPRLKPGVTNHLTWIVSGLSAFDKTVTSSVTITYYPRYLFVRPVSS